MKVVLIRHGQPDYDKVTERKMKGYGRDLAPLSQKGIQQAYRAASDPILEGCELILSSPYTRALQTAAILSEKTGIPVRVEMDLREWQPDRTQEYDSGEESEQLYQEFYQYKGIHPAGKEVRWESVAEMEARIFPVLNRYYLQGFSKIAVTAHGEMMRRFLGTGNIENCRPCEIEYDDNFQPYVWE